MILNPYEAVLDLGNGLSLIQSRKLYRFTTDAILLANFVGSLKGKSVVDLGAGSGVISILLAGEKQAKHVVSVEIQPELSDLAKRNVSLNNLSDKIEVVNLPLQGVHQTIGRHFFDCVVCNPPYRKVGSGDRQESDSLAICRHEIKVSLSEVVEEASRLLNFKGSFFLVHQSQRLAEICFLMKKFDIEPKEILPVCPHHEKKPNLVLVRGVKNGSVDCVLQAPFYLDGGLT